MLHKADAFVFYSGDFFSGIYNMGGPQSKRIIKRLEEFKSILHLHYDATLPAHFIPPT